MSEFKIGDRVRIVQSYFSEDPSRMAGGTGTVIGVYTTGHAVDLSVDNDPRDYGEEVEWTFPVDFLEFLEQPESETGEVEIGDGTEPDVVTYEEFREIVLVDGLKAAYDRLNITHK